MLTRGLFVTGTDTGVGKTFVSSLLASVFKDDDNFIYFKPVQSGADEDDDTRTVSALAGLSDEQCCVPVYRLKAPMSPDRAAALEGMTIEPKHILDVLKSLRDSFVLAEGAGGLEVPLTKDWRFSRLIKMAHFPVVIVSSTRLGTINHTLLTVEKARALGLNVLGVILNGPQDVGLKEVLEREGVEILFEVPHVENSHDNVETLAQTLRDSILHLKKKALEHFLHDPDWIKKDEQHIWHPFTQHHTEKNFPLVSSGVGSVLKLSDGNEVIDAISSWWVNLHGHAHPTIATAVANQASLLEHTIFAGYTHKPAIELSAALLAETQKLNPEIKKVFFSDNGSTAVEVALKMAYQWHQQRGDSNRSRFLALNGSYHGDTLAAMSVSEREGYHKVFQPLMAPVDFIQPDDFDALEKMRPRFKKYAACIVEPLVQGAGGMRMYSAKFLQRLATICREEKVLLVADEIFTGFYRTGTFLACELAAIQPDLICLSKGITGGFLPLAVTLTTNDLYESFKDSSKSKAFLHGHSYTANPIACAAANASWGLLQQESCQKRIQQIAQWTQEELSEIGTLPWVYRTRSLGTIGAFDVRDQEGYFATDFSNKFSEACWRRGVLIRSLGGTVYTVPPYSTTQIQLRQIYGVIKDSLWEIYRGTNDTLANHTR